VTPQLKRTFAGGARDVRESEEVECLGLSQPQASSILSGESPKLQHPGFLRMQFQAECREAFRQRGSHRARVLFLLEAHHEV
jgi:hypothetical protein